MQYYIQHTTTISFDKDGEGDKQSKCARFVALKNLTKA